MAIYEGTKKVLKLYEGTKQVLKRYNGNNLIYKSFPLYWDYNTSSYIGTMVVSSDSSKVYVINGSSKLYKFDVESGDLDWVIDVVVGSQSRGSILIDSDDAYVYVSTNDGTTHKIRTSDGDIIWTSGSVSHYSFQLAFNSDESKIIVASWYTIYEITVSNGTATQVSGANATGIVVSGSYVYYSQLGSPDKICRASLSDYVQDWGITTNYEAKSLRIDSSNTYIYLAPNDNAGRSIEVHNVSDGSFDRLITFGTEKVNEMVIDSNDDYIYTCSSDNYVRKIDLSDDSVVWSRDCGGNVYGIALAPDELTLYYGGSDTNVYQINPQTGLSS